MPELTIVKIPSRGSPPILTRCEASLAGLQGVIDGGNLQLVPPGDVARLFNDNRLSLYCDEDGIGKGLPITMQLGPHTLLGPVFFVGADPAKGEDVSLTAKQIATIGRVLGQRIAVDPRMSNGS